MSPLLAQSGHHDRVDPCPLLEAKRTSSGRYQKSDAGGGRGSQPKQQSRRPQDRRPCLVPRTCFVEWQQREPGRLLTRYGSRPTWRSCRSCCVSRERDSWGFQGVKKDGPNRTGGSGWGQYKERPIKKTLADHHGNCATAFRPKSANDATASAHM
jgi:hypothetical protein